MRRLLALLVAASFTSQLPAAGLLIPTEKKLPPLAMLDHHVTVKIDEQVAQTRIEQTFRNHTDRQLEATYIFPVPKGASVRGFSMWVDGKEEKGELVEAEKARKIYTDIVQRTLDPGLLEYMDAQLIKLRVFPVPPKGDQKISISYTSVATSDAGLVEYVYPLKTDAKAASTLEKFSLKVGLQSQFPLHNLYSPTHNITIARANDREATVSFEKNEAALDRDFQLFYTLANKDIGFNALAHRPSPGQNGYFMFLVAPRAELSKEQQAPRDMVFVLDTSGSMRGKRIAQAKLALQYCVKNLASQDRFAILNFATTVNKYHSDLKQATPENLEHAAKWVGALETSGGTAINDALLAAMAMRPTDESRTFTIVFFTDGRPTIGEVRPQQILQNVQAKNSGNTRIFTFGVGEDVNASMLDKLADDSRAIVTYIRESEDIEAKASSLFNKISNPVLANLKLSVTGADVSLSEVYPPELPDLFHGSQLVVLGRYTGQGHAAIKLTGAVGKDAKEYVYEVNFLDQTKTEKPFVEDLWARRKVGYLLDQIRVNGEKKELVEEVVTLAKRYGITTPYTSYLVVPDSVPVAGRGNPVPVNGRPNVGFNGGPPAAPMPQEPGLLRRDDRDGGKKDAAPLAEVLKKLPTDAPKSTAATSPAGTAAPGPDVGYGGGGAGFAQIREAEQKKALELAVKQAKDGKGEKGKEAKEAVETLTRDLDTLQKAQQAFRNRQLDQVQAGDLGVNLSLQNQALRNQNVMSRTANRFLQSRNVLEVGGVWIDESFNNKMPTINLKAHSKAYFRMIERNAKMREVFALGNYLVWVTPSGTALVVDPGHGQEEMSDEDIDKLFVAAAPTKKE